MSNRGKSQQHRKEEATKWAGAIGVIVVVYRYQLLTAIILNSLDDPLQCASAQNNDNSAMVRP
jgi:hypothetical protein